MSAHTPGPWFVSLGSIAGVTETHTVVLTGRDAVGVFARNDKTRKANARLIAAAPELLALVVDFERVAAMDFGPNRNDSLLDLASRARAAIAKARGGSHIAKACIASGDGRASTFMEDDE